MRTVLRRLHSTKARVLQDGPSLNDFIKSSLTGAPSTDGGHDGIDLTSHLVDPHNHEPVRRGGMPSYLIETYGCQMNVSDTEIIESILQKAGYTKSDSVDKANVVLLNTCAIREKAESTVWNRLDQLKAIKTASKSKGKPMALGVLGCMAERLKTKLLESNKLVDLVVGPDAYRDLPRLLDVVNEGRGGAEDAMNVQLSLDETYADITPVRTTKNGVSSFLSIMRGCNNMCAFCIVPFTRGRERSRDISSILDEIRMLSDQGYKEVTLLGQNVNSYFDKNNQHVLNGTYTSIGDGSGTYNSAKGFKNLYRLRDGHGPRFADLLYQVADINPDMRIRFTSPHPKDFPDQVLDVIAEKPNVCNSLHMPAQSGSTAVLDRMRRNYTREAYLDLIDHVRSRLPGVAISTDIITGFCNETEDEHQDTVSLMKQVGFDQAFMFAYSMRAKTHAYHKMEDNVSEEVKKRRLQEVVDTFRTTVEAKSKADLGTYQLVLIEGKSRRSKEDAVQWSGRNDGNKTVIVCENSSDSVGVPASISEMERLGNSAPKVRIGPGDYVMVKVVETGPNTLKALPVARSSIMEFHSSSWNLLQSNKYILNPYDRSDDETNQRSAMYG